MRVDELAVLQHVEDAADALLGIVLDVAHVGAGGVEAELVDHAGKLVGPAPAGGDLGLEVGHVLHRVAGRVGAGGQELVEGGFA